MQLVVVHVAEVIFEHHLIEPADLGDDLEDLGQHGVVAAQPGEADLPGLLEALERRLDRRVAEHLDLTAFDPVDVVAIGVVGLQPLEAGVQVLLEDLGRAGPAAPADLASS